MIISGYACSHSREDDSDPRNPLFFFFLGPGCTDRHTHQGALRCVCVTKSDHIRRFIFEVNFDGDVCIWIKMFASRSVFLVGFH